MQKQQHMCSFGQKQANELQRLKQKYTDESDQDQALDEVVKLMIKVNSMSKQKFDPNQDHKKFEFEIKFITEWINQNYEKIKPKFDYLYGPFLGD